MFHKYFHNHIGLIGDDINASPFGRLLTKIYTICQDLRLKSIKGEKIQDFFIDSTFLTKKNSQGTKPIPHKDFYWQNLTSLIIQRKLALPRTIIQYYHLGTFMFAAKQNLRNLFISGCAMTPDKLEWAFQRRIFFILFDAHRFNPELFMNIEILSKMCYEDIL